MKRNTIFMWSYISFVFICTISRLFFNFSLWNSVVLSITISSMFFSIEDLCRSLSMSLKRSLDIAEPLVSNVTESIDKDLLFFSKADEVMDKYTGTKFDFGEMREMFRGAKARAEKIKEDVNTLYEKSIKGRKSEKRYANAADIFVYLGFLCLFCTLIITSFITIPNLLQQILTVTSFTIILITQQLNNSTSERIAKVDEESRGVSTSQQEARESVQMLEKKFYEIVEAIEVNQENEKPLHENE